MKSLGKYFMVIIIGIVLTGASSLAADKEIFGTNPTTNHGEKWRIAYCEGGEYIDYKLTLIATVKGLMEIGWVEYAEIPEVKGEATTHIWDWLADNSRSNYIQFVKNAHYSADWDEKVRKDMANKIIDRLNLKKDIDLIIAMGTWAGKDLANNLHHTPTMVLTASDAVGAGIVKSNEDSGFDHVQAHVDPFRYERQVRIFHDIFKFKKLGVAYENSVNGRSYASMDLIEKVSKERQFDIVRCYTQSDIADQDLAGQSVISCFEKLIPKVDAIYVTLQGGVNTKTVPELVRITNSGHIPTFSQSGSEEVKYGFLLSNSTAGFKYVGLFHAKSIAKVFNGAMPRDLGQVFEGPPKIAINLKTAEIISFDPPMIILGAADEIYEEIQTPE
jgi:ABC-type uncharacterized transport system substrate-binding protein